MKGSGMEPSRFGLRMGAWGEIESPPPIMAHRALFMPNLRGEAPECLTAGNDFHVSLCFCRHDSWY